MHEIPRLADGAPSQADEGHSPPELQTNEDPLKLKQTSITMVVDDPRRAELIREFEAAQRPSLSQNVQNFANLCQNRSQVMQHSSLKAKFERASVEKVHLLRKAVKAASKAQERRLIRHPSKLKASLSQKTQTLNQAEQEEIKQPLRKQKQDENGAPNEVTHMNFMYDKYCLSPLKPFNGRNPQSYVQSVESEKQWPRDLQPNEEEGGASQSFQDFLQLREPHNELPQKRAPTSTERIQNQLEELTESIDVNSEELRLQSLLLEGALFNGHR